ncbi:uncharacterized protein LOC132631104 [Lycium barbarum]|uniref:uncharacterized protein LOC132631104 n=1 Tax=Lycium barbarum TaxID=112863 RepID=UPI00293E5784|nr:uncharacterized protein LOC132631104 [Lycium barbarum]
MAGIFPKVMTDKLSLDPRFAPIKQKRRPIAKYKNRFVKEEETFEVLKRFNIELNPEKCAFGVGSEKFLGFLVSNRGIKVNPDKIKAIEEILEVLEDVKAVQKLTEKLAALSRFISRSSEKSHQFFSLLKRKKDFKWMPKSQQSLRDLKKYLSNVSLLSKPLEGEQLLVYLVVSKVAENKALLSMSSYFYRNNLSIKEYVAKPELLGRLANPKMVPEVEGEFIISSEALPGVWTLFIYGATSVKWMQKYLDKVQILLCRFKEWTMEYILREQNFKADALANLRSSTDAERISSKKVVLLLNSALDLSRPKLEG